MTTPGSAVSCPSCGTNATGRYCASCGARVGAPLAGSALGRRSALPWLVPGIAVIALLSFLVGQRVSHSSPRAGRLNDGSMFAGADVPGAALGGSAPDISAMSPEERATRLFDRVMRYGEQGKLDSVRLFAPMAIQAYEMLGAIDAHRRYDIGMIAVVSGDAATASAAADSILAKNRAHLLGLILAMKAAGLRRDTAAGARFEKRFLAALPSERAKRLREYAEHQPDIDAALKTAQRQNP